MDLESYLLHEYRVLTDYYFHEDGAFFTAVQLYVVINAGMLTVLSVTSATKSRPLEVGAVAFAVLLSSIWCLVLARIRAWRMVVERRMDEIELLLRATVSVETMPIRPFAEVEDDLHDRWWSSRSSSGLLVWLPAIIGLLWVVIGGFTLA